MIRRLLSGDPAWIWCHLRIALGLRGVVPKPDLLASNVIDAVYAKNPSPDTPLNVIFFSHNLDREGASISLKELIYGLKDSKEYPSIAPQVVTFKDGALRAEYESHGIAVHVLPNTLHQISTARRLSNLVQSLSERIQALGAHLVFANTLTNFTAILAAEHAGVPSVWNVRESEPWNCFFRFLPDPVAQRAIAAIGLPRKVIFVADATRSVWKDFEHVARFEVIHNALRLERFAEQLTKSKVQQRAALGWSENEVVFLCVGTLCKRKGQADALHALEQIAGELKTPVRLVFVGDAVWRYALKLRVIALRLAKFNHVTVDFVSATQNVASYYHAADAFMLCSRVESYPRVILEALNFSLPIISTPIFGVAEQLPDTADACFYEPGDVDSLGKHMLAMANDPELRRHFSQRSHHRFSQMPDFNKMIKAYQRVLVESASTPLSHAGES